MPIGVRLLTNKKKNETDKQTQLMKKKTKFKVKSFFLNVVYEDNW